MRVSSYLQGSGKYSWLLRTAAALICLAAASSLAADESLSENPYAPAYGHAYRHGAVPTREAAQRMREWQASRPAAQRRRRSNTLAFGGGIDGIGVTSGTPKVYLVFYGSQWTSGGDPHGAATYLQNLFRGIGTGGGKWAGPLTADFDGPALPKGATPRHPRTPPPRRLP